jgi:hypothetical protein
VRGLYAVMPVLCAGCLSSPPDSTVPPGDASGESPDAGDACVRYPFADIDGFYKIEEPGCHVEVDGRVHFVQDASMAPADGCLVEPMPRLAGRSVSLYYGGESDIPVAVIVYGDGGEIDLSAGSSTIQLTRYDADDTALDQDEATFQPAWHSWRIDWDEDAVHVSAGGEPSERKEVLSVAPSIPFSGFGVVLGSWPGQLPGAEREASFDDLAVCP